MSERRILRSVVEARLEDGAWKLRLACGHEGEASVKPKRHASPYAPTEHRFEPPPARQRCPACERERDGTPTLF